jgi:hypothetical protein
VTEYRFVGTERVTIELEGTFDPSAFKLPAGLVLDVDKNRARVSLFAFHVDELRVIGMPVVAASYAEVLWRVAVRRNGARAWWVTACDLNARGPGWAARRWVRYPVRKSKVHVLDARPAEPACTGIVADEGGISFALGPDGDPAIIERRSLLTGALYEVPWGDDGTGARRAPVRAMTDTLARVTVGSPVEWSGNAVIRRGRAHRCGVATACR